MKKFLIIIPLLFIGAFFVDPVKAAFDPFDGRLVKTPSNTAVYYVGLDNKRHAFPNEKIYFSWFSDFSRVEVISEFEMALYQLGKNITYRPGARLIKIPSVPEVYAVEPWGVLRNIPDEQAAIDLYGENWAQFVDDIDISFFFDYSIGGVIDVVDERAIFPAGTYVNFDSIDYLIDKRSDGIFLMRPVTDYGHEAGKFNNIQRHIITDNSLREFFEIGVPYTVPEAGFNCPSCIKSEYEEVSLLDTEIKLSENNKHQVNIPSDWDITFFNDISPTIMLSASSDFINADESFTVTRFDASNFDDSLDEFMNSVRSIDADTDEAIYDSKSMMLPTGYERAVLTGDNFVSWSYYFQQEDDIYSLSFASEIDHLGDYADLLHLLITSYKSDPLIDDTTS